MADRLIALTYIQTDMGFTRYRPGRPPCGGRGLKSEITGVTCEARPPIRAGKYDKAKDAVRKVNRQRRRPPAPAQQKVPTGFPW